MFCPSQKIRTVGALLIALTGALSVSACASNSADSTLNIFAAASTRVINDELAELASPTQLEFINAGSTSLAQQLADGAPGDIFISADTATMDKAQQAKTVKDPRVVAQNRMVVIVPPDNPGHITSFSDLSQVSRVVTCDVTVPCGAITAELEQANNIKIQAVSHEQSVSDVLGKVLSGEANAGIVYETDAHAAGSQVQTIPIPHSEEHLNSIVAAVVSESSHPERAEKILALLTSPEMKNIWEEHGFLTERD